MEDIKKEKYTPMMQQYLTVKEGYPDTLVFYRLGDFYELFFDDAKIASKELDLVLTGKNAGVEEKVPMCGVPHHAVSSYLQKLVQRGYKVAIVEQVEDPKQAKGIVERDVVRVITPGTIMNEISDDKQSVYIASIEDYKYGYGLAIVEMSTGESFVENISHSFQELTQTILKNSIKEVVLSSSFDEKVIRGLREINVVISYCDETDIDPIYQPLIENLTSEFDLTAYGRMLKYLEATQKHLLAHLDVVTIEDESSYLNMDFATTINLELTTSLNRQTKQETLWSFLDECQSAMGSRLLKKWIEKPLVDKDKIIARQDKVEWLYKEFMSRQALKDYMSNIYDLQRLIARCAMNTANAIDCVRLSKTLKQVPGILDILSDDVFSQYHNLDPLTELCKSLDSALVEDPPALMSDGGIFKDGYNAELDQARSIQRNGRQFIAELEAKEREKTGIKTLKIGYNKVFGYYIEISKAAAEQVKDEWGYVRKQTLVNNERFISQELKEKEDAILHAEENAIRLERQLFAELIESIKSYLPKLQKLALALAEIDCLYALAECSSRYGYVRPTFSDDVLDIKEGKHPILDQQMKDPHYVANGIYMDKDNDMLIITGPNMGGKSTYMRQIALIVIMAQMGCFVPASSCTMPCFDKIFTRIGANDDILQGQSTFMVEMVEANHALQNATRNSLILFDEIGRGTSTYDGMALAQAMIEYIASIIHAKTLFSTHYHELTSVCEELPTVHNVHVEVKEEKDNVTFLYKIKEGSADRSYGINVAKLAGLPESVIDRAKGLQSELESSKRVVQQSVQFIEVEKEDIIRKRLKDVSIDDLSPRQAWQLLLELSEELKKE